MGQYNGYTKLVKNEAGEWIRVNDPDRNISEIAKLEAKIAELQAELAKLKETI